MFHIYWPASMKLNSGAAFVVLCTEVVEIPDLNCVSHQPKCTQVLCNFIFAYL